jgi:hypothetical protein
MSSIATYPPRTIQEAVMAMKRQYHGTRSWPVDLPSVMLM